MFVLLTFLIGQDFAVSFIGRDYDYAPELLNQGHTSKKSDIYQLGLILYFCLTGKAAITTQDGPSSQVRPISSGVQNSFSVPVLPPCGQTFPLPTF